MSAEPGNAVGAVVFDVYGTLLDVGAAVEPARRRIGERADRLGELWRRKQLEYSWLRSLMRAHRDFEGLTADALDWALRAIGIEDRALAAELLAGYRRLPAFAEAEAALAALRAGGLRLAVLSNGTTAMLEAGLEAARLRPHLDHVLSVESVGVFKPAAEVYAIATSTLGLAAGRIAFVSANGWDAHAAAWNGFRAFRVDRAGLPDELLPGDVERGVASLAELPGLLLP